METERTPLGVKFTRWMLNSLPPPTYVKAVGFQGRIDRCQRFEFVAPARFCNGPAPPMPAAIATATRPTASCSSACIHGADAGDRDLVLLLLVGRERLPPGRAGGDGAILRADRRRVPRGQDGGRGAAGATERAWRGGAGGHRQRRGTTAHAPHHGAIAGRGGRQALAAE